MPKKAAGDGGRGASERSWLQAARANRGLWPWVVGILAFELLLAYVLPASDLSGFTTLNAAVDTLARVAPVIHNFDRAAPHPSGLALYFAIATLLIAPKAVLAWRWLNSSAVATYRHFVISPLTATTPASPNDFIEQPIRDQARAENPRTLGSRIRWSLAIVVFALLGFLFMLQLGWEIAAGQQSLRRTELAQLAGGGFWLWAKWSLSWTSFGALLLAILASVLRDSWLFLQQRLAGDEVPDAPEAPPHSNHLRRKAARQERRDHGRVPPQP